MSIEQLKKILESERNEMAHRAWGFEGTSIREAGYYKRGHEAAANRLLPLLEKAVEMIEFVDLNTSFCQEHRRNQDIPFCSYSECDIKIKAREFIAKIKKECE